AVLVYFSTIDNLFPHGRERRRLRAAHDCARTVGASRVGSMVRFQPHHGCHFRTAVLQPLLRPAVEHGPRFCLGGVVRRRLGWPVGLLTLSGRARLLVVTGIVSYVLLDGYSLLYLLLSVPWQAPLPVYLAHGLFPLFVIAAVAGYWGALRVAALSAGRVTATVGRRDGIKWFFHHTGAPTRLRLLTAAAAFVAVAIIPAAFANFA